MGELARFDAANTVQKIEQLEDGHGMMVTYFL